MTQTTTQAQVDIRLEDDATPVVRLLGRALRASADAGHALPVLHDAAGAVALRSHDTPQVATITLDRGRIEVASGIQGDPTASVVVDPHARLATAEDSTGDAELAADVLRALSPPVPDWRTAAERFWAATRDIAGMPDVLVVVTETAEGLEQLVLGEGETQYLMAADPDTLAGIFSGADDLFAVLSTGALGIQGTLSQLSVMVGASWRVRLHV
jgi:hypothetical protein